MDRFVCKLDTAALEQFVFLPDGANLKIYTKDFGLVLATLCHEYENYRVSLIGNKEFVQGIIQDIKEQEAKQYGHNIINIDYLDGSNWE